MFECFSIFRVISCDDPITIGMPGSRNADGGAAQPRPGLPWLDLSGHSERVTGAEEGWVALPELILVDVCNWACPPRTFIWISSNIFLFLFLFNWFAKILSRLRILAIRSKNLCGQTPTHISLPRSDSSTRSLACCASHAWRPLVLPVNKNLISTLRPGNIIERSSTIPSFCISNTRPTRQAFERHGMRITKASNFS